MSPSQGAWGGGEPLTSQQQHFVRVIYGLGRGPGVVAEGVTCAADGGARWPRDRACLLLGPRPTVLLPGPLAHHFSSLASGPRAPEAASGVAGARRVGQGWGGSGCSGGRPGGSPRPTSPGPPVTYEERGPGLDAALAAVQAAEGLCEVDAELLLAARRLAGGQQARHTLGPGGGPCGGHGPAPTSPSQLQPGVPCPRPLTRQAQRKWRALRPRAQASEQKRVCRSCHPSSSAQR